MESNNNDYVLILEDRTEVKNEAEVGKLSVVSNIDEKGKLKPAPLPLFCYKKESAYSDLWTHKKKCHYGTAESKYHIFDEQQRI